MPCGAGEELARFAAGPAAAPARQQLAVHRVDADLLLQPGEVEDIAGGIEVERVGLGDPGPLGEEAALGVEDLDAVIGAVAHPDAVLVSPRARRVTG